MGQKKSYPILVIFLIPSVLSAMLLAWFWQGELHSWAIKRWSTDHSAFVNTLGKQIEANISSSSNLLKYTSSLPQFSSLPDLDRVDQHYNGIPYGLDMAKRSVLDSLKREGSFSVLFVLTPTGDHYLSHPYRVQQSLKKFNLSDRAYFVEASQTKKFVISDSFVGADGVPAVAIDVPILGSDGEIIAHLGGVKHLKNVSLLVSSSQIAPFDRALILDRQGSPVTLGNTDKADYRFETVKGSEFTSSDGLISIQYATDNEGTLWLSFHRTLDLGWQLIVMRRMDALQQEVAPQIRYTLWLGIGIIFLTSMIGAIVALRFSKRWREADAALQRSNETLEQRVEQRTAELERSEVRHRTLFESTGDAVLLLSQSGLIDCNNSALQMFGVTDKEALLKLDIADLSAALQFDGSDSRKAAEIKIEECFKKGLLQFEWLHKRLDNNRFFPADVTLSKLILDEKPILQASVRDISERKRAETRIRTLSQVVEQSPVSVVITDTNGDIEYVNQTFKTVTGYSEEEVLGKNSRILKSGHTPFKHYEELWRALKTGESWLGEFQNKKKNGELFWEQVYFTPVVDPDGSVYHFLALKLDITQQKLQEEHILHQAHFDSLTDLPNRFLSLNRLGEYIKEAKRKSTNVAVIFMDLDDFKKINDSLGHEVGDKLLQQIAKRLRMVIREEDTLGRLGGDEFIILLRDLKKPADAEPVVEKLLGTFGKPICVNNRNLAITASIGIAVYPDNGETPATLLRKSDTAMYHSKSEGRNTYQYFTAEMNRNAHRRLEVEGQLRTALENKELTVYYQPLIDIQSQAIIGAEALLRWNNSKLGSVPPDEFIAIAEHTGLIIPIGEFVLSQALSITPECMSLSNNRFRMAINLSPRQFRDPGLISFIQDQIQLNGIQGCNVELEITEGVLMAGHHYIDDALEQLCQQEIRISMDDFGTGYSSLSYLRSYPFGTLKIDRSFINDITIDHADRELVNAAIAMAHGLGLKVIAEGVETEGQFKYLLEKECDYAQGFFFSKPIPEEQFKEMLLKQQ